MGYNLDNIYVDFLLRLNNLHPNDEERKTKNSKSYS